MAHSPTGFASLFSVYCTILGNEEDFPPLPISSEGTPCKEPVRKKALVAKGEENSGIILTPLKLSEFINTHFDTVEKLVIDNSLKTEGFKKSIDFAIEEIKDVKKRVNSIENRTKKDDTLLEREKRLIDSERYSRRWNLKLYGVPETVSKEDVKKETIRICQAIFPEGKQKLPDVIDSVHCLGKMRENNSRPRGIILHFSS
ncbi:hypothetical protein XENOCAPTIV_016057 [Xenoophorus captivus]|uniref:Uncharacterized protein n=1 Tax=Xenoophorus captivus TaxID=1517983 RepID=A0ABV0QII2_9TELE